ncbi:MAG: DUF664 domain-containing protein [Ilumatobacteraceae bacterium]
MDIAALLDELFGRVAEHVHEAVDGLDPATLVLAPAPDANPIGWLVWHLTRVQDHHVSELLDEPQLWVTGAWAPRFGLDPDPDNTGYGHTPDDVRQVRPDGSDALVGYFEAVAARTGAYLATLDPSDLDRIVDERWDPPVTLGVRLVSIADDDIQHGGQAAYVRGLVAPE